MKTLSALYIVVQNFKSGTATLLMWVQSSVLKGFMQLYVFSKLKSLFVYHRNEIQSSVGRQALKEFFIQMRKSFSETVS